MIYGSPLLTRAFRLFHIVFLHTNNRPSSDIQSTKHGGDGPLPRRLVAEEPPLLRHAALLPALAQVGRHLFPSPHLVLRLEPQEACRLRYNDLIFLDPHPSESVLPVVSSEGAGYSLRPLGRLIRHL